MNIATQCPCCDGINLKSQPSTLAPFVADRVFGDTNIPSHTMICESCGFLFLDIRFSPDEMFRLYDNYRGDDYVALREKYEPGCRDRNEELLKPSSWLPEIEKFIERHITLPIIILDWGGNNGMNSPFKGNRQLFIYDIGNIQPLVGERVIFPDGQYDLIVCASVLEHVPYPFQTMSEIYKAASSDTIIYIDVPIGYNGRGVWHEHINIFNPSAIDVLLDRCGFEIIEQQYLENPPLLQTICKRKK